MAEALGAADSKLTLKLSSLVTAGCDVHHRARAAELQHCPLRAAVHSAEDQELRPYILHLLYTVPHFFLEHLTVWKCPSQQPFPNGLLGSCPPRTQTVPCLLSLHVPPLWVVPEAKQRTARALQRECPFQCFSITEHPSPWIKEQTCTSRVRSQVPSSTNLPVVVAGLQMNVQGVRTCHCPCGGWDNRCKRWPKRC